MAVVLSHSATLTLPRLSHFRPCSQFLHFSLFSSSSVVYPHHLCFHYPFHSENSGSINNGGIRKMSRAQYLQEGIATIRSPDLVAMEYSDLNLPQFCEEVGHVRIRQHVNPLTLAFSVPVEPPDWNVVFKDSSLPLTVDIGCGSGRFLLWLAKRNPTSNNYLGLEIRKKLVKRANFWVKELNLFNVHFIIANATVSFQQLVSSYPGQLVFVSILCPDPYFKQRHRKRRVLQKPLVDSIVNNLTTGGEVLVQSDVVEVAADMRNQFDDMTDLLHMDAINPSFDCDPDGWLLNNPMGIRTEREIHAEHEGSKMYRRLYQKKSR